MEKLGSLIVSKTLDKQNIKIERRAARGIIMNDNKEVLLIHSKYYHDYTFPGGGVEKGETDLEALHRECSEEAGVLIKNIRPFYSIREQRELNETEYLDQVSAFYLCDLAGTCKMHLEDYEVELGYEPVWLKIDEAIKLDYKKMSILKSEDYDGVLIRELRVLWALREENNEN